MSSGALSGEELHHHWCPSTAYNCLLSIHQTVVPTSTITSDGSESVKLVLVHTRLSNYVSITVSTENHSKVLPLPPTLLSSVPFMCHYTGEKFHDNFHILL